MTGSALPLVWRIRSWWDVNLFSLRVLRPFRAWLGIVWILLIATSAGLLLGDYRTGAWLSFAAGGIGLAFELVPFGRSLFTTPRAVLRQDNSFQARLRSARPADVELHDGFGVHIAPGTDEPVVRSELVDEWLRSTDVPLTVEPRALESLNESLLVRAASLEVVLRCRYRESWRSDPPRLFFNEDKVCLVDNPSPSGGPLRVFRGTYFHGTLTNELVTRHVETVGAHPEIVVSGREMFPAIGTDSETPQLLRLAESYMSNHIGVSTVVITNDGKLQVWNQGASVQQNRNRLVPTGSGSCDWSDLDQSGGGSLVSLLQRAMAREFAEESSLTEGGDFEIDTFVVGYFRWLRRGGKPEFVGLSRVSIDSDDLKPDIREVNAPRRSHKLTYPARSLRELRSSIQELLASPLLSVPLAVNLTAIGQALDDPGTDWSNRLRLVA